MPLFAYKVVNAQGGLDETICNADDEHSLLLQLQAQGLMVIAIRPAKANTFLGLPLAAASGTRLSHKQVLRFTTELATLLESGLPLDRAFTLLHQITEKQPPLQRLVDGLLAQVKAGKSLADALDSQGVFSKFYINLIRAGELGGHLAPVLQRLADYLERSQQLKDTVSTALIYPALLLVMSLVSLAVMLVFVVPQFKDMFDSAGQALPLPTQIVMGLADGLQHYGWLLVLLLAAVWFWVQYQQTDPARKLRWDAGLLRLPLLGEVLLQRETAHFSRTFGTLLGNGVSLVKALSIVRETVDNHWLAAALTDSEAQVKQGQSLSEALAHYPYFPVLALQMIKMGEETGRLEDMLLRLADIYDKQLKTTIQRALALLEPVLIIGLGLLIAGIIVSILLAILSINDLAV